MQSTARKLGSVVLAVALVAGVCLLSVNAKADVAAGAAAYKTKCAACHGLDGKGKDAMKTRDFASPDIQKQTDAELSATITNGKGKMPAYKSLTPEQVKDLVSYIRSLKK